MASVLQYVAALQEELEQGQTIVWFIFVFDSAGFERSKDGNNEPNYGLTAFLFIGTANWLANPCLGGKIAKNKQHQFIHRMKSQTKAKSRLIAVALAGGCLLSGCTHDGSASTSKTPNKPKNEPVATPAAPGIAIFTPSEAPRIAYQWILPGAREVTNENGTVSLVLPPTRVITNEDGSLHTVYASQLITNADGSLHIIYTNR